MKTQKCSQGWRRYLTSSFLLLGFIVILVILKAIFGIQRESENMRNYLNKKVVVLINDEIIVDKKLKKDTLNIYLNKHYTRYLDTSRVDTVVIDTTITK